MCIPLIMEIAEYGYITPVCDERPACVSYTPSSTSQTSALRTNLTCFDSLYIP